MPTLRHRLQVLLDDERLDLLEREARSSGRTVADLVRSAVDSAYGHDPTERRSAVAELLAEAPMPVDDWAGMKRAMLDELSETA